MDRRIDRSGRAVLTILAAAFLAVAAISTASAQETPDARTATAGSETAGTVEQDAMLRKLIEMAPYRGYLAAHRDVEDPPELLGGPVQVKLAQESGGVHVALPDQRELDPDVFGTPKMPRAFAGTPGINGLPPKARVVEDGEFTKARPMTPFGDEAVVMGRGRLVLELTDATAVDAASTEDRVKFRATWQDEAGNTYEVRCCEMLAAHGVEYPTFGGVVTNHLLHGSSRIGTALMPTEFTYAAFWGMGRILKNGEVRQAPRLVHGMLTEYVRGQGYALASDEEVTPTRKHFHLMVPPMMPDTEAGRFRHSDVKTGFQLPNGEELPFWHVMFGNLDVRASRGGS